MKNLVKISFLILYVFSISVFQSCNNNDERYRKEIVGAYSYAKTMDIDKENTLTMEGIFVFDANGHCENNGTMTVTIIDEEGDSHNLKIRFSMKGKYSIKNSIISYDFQLKDVDAAILQYDSYEVAEFFQQHFIPEFKHSLCVDNTEKIIELNEKYLKTEDIDEDGEKIVITYLRISDDSSSNEKTGMQEEDYDYGIDYGLTKEEMPADFLAFLKNFTSSRESQISHIHTPLIHKFLVDNENFEEKTEYWNEEKIITDWRFVKSDEFIWGLKKGVFGSWKMENGEINYNTGDPDADTIWKLTFKKVSDNWCLFSFWTDESNL